MSSIWTRSLKASPQYDCGLCGYPKCASFTRAAIVGFTTIDKCPVLQLASFKDAKDELQTLIARKTGLRFRIATELPEGGVVLTRPCKDTDQKVMAELRVYNGVDPGDRINFGVFDPVLLCELAECMTSEFEEVKCSKDLGYGRADTGEMSITLLQDGRVNMRRVNDKQQVLNVFDTIERTILGSTVCNCCGNDLISIVSGLVTHQDAHTVLKCGSSIKLDCDILKEPLTSKLFRDIFNNAQITEEIDLIAKSLSQDLTDISLDNMKTSISIPSDLRCRLISLVFENDTKTKQSILMRMLGFLWILERTLDSMKMIENTISTMGSNDSEILNGILSSVSDDIEIDVPSTDADTVFKIYALSRSLLRGKRAIAIWQSQ